MKFLFGLLGLGVIALAFKLEGGDFFDLVHGGAGLLVLGATVFLSLAHHSGRDLMGAFKAALGTDEIAPEDAARHVTVLSTIRMIALASGAVGFIMGLVDIFKNLNAVERVGAGVAVALMSVLYALILSEFFLGPLSNRVCARAGGKPGDPLKAATASGLILTISTLGGLFCLALVLFIVMKAG